jgi:hypothetical protein
MLLFFGYACANHKAETVKAAETQRSSPDYYFFPKANVYFDSANKEYLFMAGDSSSWISEKQIPAVMLAMMDKSVRIDSPQQPVWQDNQNHRLIYSAVLYASPTDTVEKKEPKPAVKIEMVQKKKEKKGLAKFFSKIFGKKKDNEKKE